MPGRNVEKNKIIVTDRKPTVTVKNSDQENKNVKFEKSDTIGKNLEKEMTDIAHKKIVQTRLEKFQFKKLTKELDQNCAQETKVMKIVKGIEKTEKNMTGKAKKEPKIVTGRIQKNSSPILRKTAQKKQNTTTTPRNQKNQKSRLVLFSSWTRNQHQNMPTGDPITTKTSSLSKFSFPEEDIKTFQYSIEKKEKKLYLNLPSITAAKEGARICDHPTASQEIEIVPPTRS